MGKKDRKNRSKSPTPPAETPRGPILSKRGKKLIASGIAGVVLGFIVLSFTDARGQNLASRVSPFLLILGYTLIGVGIIAKDPPPAGQTETK